MEEDLVEDRKVERMEEARADKNASRDRGMGMLPGPYRALGLKPFHQMMIDQG